MSWYWPYLVGMILAGVVATVLIFLFVGPGEPTTELLGIRYSLQEIIPGGKLAGVGADCMAILLRTGDTVTLLESFCDMPLPGFPVTDILITPLD